MATPLRGSASGPPPTPSSPSHRSAGRAVRGFEQAQATPADRLAEAALTPRRAGTAGVAVIDTTTGKLSAT